ncbi:MAG: DUF3783 domain-containing protein [Lachnospiraceae bacterium]|nr:DUF3783 domain-containing protein [Lachnospiraceae bacterium]
MRKNNGETVLLYNIVDKSLQKKYQIVCLKLGIRVKAVKKEQLKEPVGALAGAKEVALHGEIYEGEGFVEPMMVMKGFGSARLDEFLLALKKDKIPKIDLKAVLTEYNKEWDSFQLYEELKKEHAVMSQEK